MNTKTAMDVDTELVLGRVRQARTTAADLSELLSRWQLRMDSACVAIEERGRSAEDVFREHFANGGPVERRQLHETLRRFEHCMHELRALCVRSQVAAGATSSEIARQTGVSVQMIRRLDEAGRTIARERQ